jgi:integrase
VTVEIAQFTVKRRSSDQVVGVVKMGFSRKRTSRDGKPRYTAYYVDAKGHERSAGTFSNKKEADKAWHRKETQLAEGRVGDPARGRMLFQRYVENTWLPNHVMEPSTREGYTYSIYKHIMPEFDSMRMIDILPEHVRAWVATLQKDGVGVSTIQHCKVILSAIFTTALNDQVTFFHPCKGVKTPPVVAKPLEIITPEQFDLVYQALPNTEAQLLMETDIESGLRWGELTELRVKDLDFQTHILTVSRAVIEVNPKFHPEGKRFWVKEYPKGKEHRRLKLSDQIFHKLKTHRDAQNLTRDDLLFSIRNQQNNKPAMRIVPNPDELELCPPNEKGRQYKHGTLSAYTAGKCRCDDCRAAYAIYRAQRRAQGRDNPRTPRALDTDGHIPANWFRNQVWKPAVKTAGLASGVRIHDLRHAHASWLLAGGADLQVVKERLGHGSIATTERYLHSLPEADKTALDAFSTIRYRSSNKEADPQQEV